MQTPDDLHRPDTQARSSSGIRVLIVDRSKEDRYLLTALIRTDPELVVVGEATNGFEAIAQYDRLRPDVVSTDIAMPEMDGIEASRAICSLGDGARILILSVLYDSNYLRQAIAAGVTDMLAKPPNADEYLKAIKTVAKLPPHRPPSLVASHFLSSEAPPVGSLSRSSSTIRVLIVDNSKEMRETLSACVRTDRELVVVGEATNGFEAIAQYDRLRPDVVTMEIDMPEMGGIEASRAICSLGDGARILVLSVQNSAEHLHQRISACVSESLTKPPSADEYLSVIKRVAKLRPRRPLPLVTSDFLSTEGTRVSGLPAEPPQPPPAEPFVLRLQTWYEAFLAKQREMNQKDLALYPLSASRRATAIATVFQHINATGSPSPLALTWWRLSWTKGYNGPDWAEVASKQLSTGVGDPAFPTLDEWMTALANTYARATAEGSLLRFFVVDFISMWSDLQRAKRIDSMLGSFTLLGAARTAIASLTPKKLPKEGSLERELYRRAFAMLEATACLNSTR